MDIRSWTWMHLALVIVGYWAVVIAAWWFHVTRPAQQARARAKAAMHTIHGSQPGEEVVVLSGTINFTRVLAVLLGPPVVLIVEWLVL